MATLTTNGRAVRGRLTLRTRPYGARARAAGYCTNVATPIFGGSGYANWCWREMPQADGSYLGAWTADLYYLTAYAWSEHYLYYMTDTWHTWYGFWSNGCQDPSKLPCEGLLAWP